jgi:protein TonB
MSTYSGTANRPDRAKAIAAVIAVHVALAAVILTGLNVRMVSAAVERLKTFDIREPPPPPPNPPPPAPKPHEAKREAGAPARKAEPTPVVAPKPRLPVQSPIPAAPIAGTGSASSSGAASSGTGTGAGGAGNGPGGGGDYSGFTPARLKRNLTRSDYRRLTAGRLPFGSADVWLQIDPRGRVSACRLIRSSGDSGVDAGLCPLIASQLFFRPAFNAQGQPVAYSTNFHATWSI